MSLEAEFQQHAPFLRALARRLAGDQFAAEDLVQETYVEASGGKPRAENGWLPWLAGILRNRAARRIRTDSRRRSREQVVATNSDAPAAASVAGKLDVGRRLLQHVEELGGDYRDVVFMRFYDDLQPKQIAVKLELPVATVKTRLARALAKLRERLNADDADGKRNWLPALCALGGFEPGAGAPTTIAPIMRRAFTMRVAAVAIVMLVTGAVLWPLLPGGPEPTPPIATSPTPATVKEVAEQQQEPARQQQVAAPVARQVRGMVEDAALGAAPGSGLPARNVAVTCELHFKVAGRAWPRSEERRTTTDGGGTFSFTVPEGARVASIKTASSDSHRKVYWASKTKDDAFAPLVLTRYPSGILEGQVLEPSGVPVGGATVTLGYREGDEKRTIETTADESGRFVFNKVPEDSWLDGQKDGYIRIGAAGPRMLAKGGWQLARILMAPTATLVVHVADAKGKPVRGLPGVAVAISQREGGLFAWLNSFGRGFRDNQQAADGTAVLTVPADLALMVYSANTPFEHVRDGRLVPREEAAGGHAIKLARGERRELRMTVAANCVVRGKVVGPDGEPVPTAYIQFERDEGKVFESIGVIDVDADGKFEHRFHAARPFRALLSATAMFGDKRYGIDRLLTVNGEDSFDETLVLSEASCVRGRVRDAGGKAIAATVRVAVRLPDGQDYTHCGDRGTTKDGLFRVSVAPELDYRFEVAAKGYVTRMCGLRLGKETDIVLEPQPCTRVRLRPLIASARAVTPSLPAAPGRFGRMDVRVGYFEPGGDAQPEWPSLPGDHSWHRASARSVATDYREAGVGGAWRWESLGGVLRDGVLELDLDQGPAVILASGMAPNNAIMSRHTTGPVLIGSEDVDLTVTFAPTVKRVGRILFAEKFKVFDAYIAVADDKGTLLSVNAVGNDYQWQRMLRTSSHGHFAIAGIPVGVWEVRVGTKAELERGDARWRQRMVFEPGEARPLIVKL